MSDEDRLEKQIGNGPSGEAPGERLGQSDPVFTPPRRPRGPGKAIVLKSLVTVVAIGAAVGVWLKFSDGTPEGAQIEAPSVADDAAPIAAADTAEVTEPEPEPEPPPPVRLSLTVQPGAATVLVDDTLTVGPDGALMPPGPHTVHAESEGYLPLDTVVELGADTALALVLTRAPPTTGTMAVRASIPGRVLVNGRDRGAAPLRGLELRPGSYTVRFVPDGAEALAEERSVRVVAGEAASASFDITDALLSVGVREPRWATVYAGEARLGDTPLIEHRLPARVYQIRVEREGYVAQERLIRLEPGQHVEWVDIVLAREGE
jgi:hypothetical protein